MNLNNQIKPIWETISSEGDLKNILQMSSKKTQLVYKHSPSCSISYLAKEGLDEHIKELVTFLDIHIIDVIAQRSIARFVAENFDIRHESPQAILLADEQVLWHGSHWKVNFNEIVAQILN